MDLGLNFDFEVFTTEGFTVGGGDTVAAPPSMPMGGYGASSYLSPSVANATGRGSLTSSMVGAGVLSSGGGGGHPPSPSTHHQLPAMPSMMPMFEGEDVNATAFLAKIATQKDEALARQKEIASIEASLATIKGNIAAQEKRRLQLGDTSADLQSKVGSLQAKMRSLTALDDKLQQLHGKLRERMAEADVRRKESHDRQSAVLAACKSLQESLSTDVSEASGVSERLIVSLMPYFAKELLDSLPTVESMAMVLAADGDPTSGVDDAVGECSDPTNHGRRGNPKVDLVIAELIASKERAGGMAMERASLASEPCNSHRPLDVLMALQLRPPTIPTEMAELAYLPLPDQPSVSDDDVASDGMLARPPITLTSSAGNRDAIGAPLTIRSFTNAMGAFVESIGSTLNWARGEKGQCKPVNGDDSNGEVLVISNMMRRLAV